MRRQIGAALIAASLLFALAAFLLWRSSSESQESEQLAEEYRAAIVGTAPEDVTANRVPALAAAGVSAVIFLGGVVVLAAER